MFSMYNECGKDVMLEAISQAWFKISVSVFIINIVNIGNVGPHIGLYYMVNYRIGYLKTRYHIADIYRSQSIFETMFTGCRKCVISSMFYKLSID